MWRTILFTLGFILLLNHPTSATDEGAFQSKILFEKNIRANDSLYLSGSSYRLETTQSGQPITLLVDLKNGQTHLLDSRQKTYAQLDTRSQQSLAINPIEVFRLTAGYYPQQSRGQETLKGMTCRKVVYLNNGRHLMTAWFSKNVPIPIKVSNHYFPEMNFELINIQSRAIEPDLLALPSDYQLTTDIHGHAPAPTEWFIKNDASQKVDLAAGQAFKLIVTEDESDGLATKGRIILFRKAPPPTDRVEAPLKIPNGKSFPIAYPASALIIGIEFQIAQGGIHVKQVQPK